MEEALARHVERLRQRQDVEEIVLFGSLVSGTPVPGSDVDLLIIAERQRAAVRGPHSRVLAHGVPGGDGRLPVHAERGGTAEGRAQLHRPGRAAHRTEAGLTASPLISRCWPGEAPAASQLFRSATQVPPTHLPDRASLKLDACRLLGVLLGSRVRCNMDDMRASDSVVLVDPEILGGTPVFRGTRVPVKNLLDYLAAGDTLDQFLDDFPTVKREQAVAALELARDLLTACAPPAR